MRLNVSTLALRFTNLAVSGILAMPLPSATPAEISGPAYALLLDRATAPRNSFYIYQDADSAFNHGVPSGVFGAVSKVRLNAACIDDPAPSNTSGCSTAAQAFDTNRGTVFSISFNPLVSTEFAGVNFEEPTTFATRSGTRGYDLRGATRLVFDVRSPTPGGIRVQFGIAGQTSDFVLLPQSANYSSMSLPLTGIDLSSTHILFTIVTNAANAPAGGTVLVDNVRVDPAPRSQASGMGLPLTYQTFGVTPVSSAASSRVPVPPDQQLKNLAAVYDSSLLVLALARRGSASDLAAVKAVADALDNLLQHDNHGFPLPAAPDGSPGFHSGYEAGESTLFNDQVSPGKGLSGDAKLAGFSGGTAMCGSSAFCLVLNGGSSGANAAAVLALIAAYRGLQDPRYLNDARQVGKWLLGMSAQGAGYGGFFNGYDDTISPPLTLNEGKSTETNALIYAGFTALADAEQELGDRGAASQWSEAANAAGDFVMQMFNPSGRFYAGTIPSNIAPGPGIVPTGDPKGSDVINSFDFLDANTLPILSLATSSRYQGQIDWRLPVRWILQNYPRTIQAANQAYQGLGLVATNTSGPNGIAWEFTAQAVLAMRIVDRIYGEAEFENSADIYLAQIRQNQTSAPFGDGRGLTAATMQNGDTLAPYDQCLSTPFQCIPTRVALAATSFAIFAEQRISPFTITPRIAPGGVFNAASFQPAPNNTLSPGTIFSIFGAALADTTSTASFAGTSLPTVLRGTGVQLNGVCAPLFYVSPTQINAQVPDLPVASATVRVSVSTGIAGNNDCTAGTPTATQGVPFAATSPGLLTLGNGQGTVLAQHSADYSLVQSGSPAKSGEIVVLYGTGFGATTPAMPAGLIVNTTATAPATPTVMIGGVSLAPTDILFAGLTQGFAGLWQFNLRIPAGVAAGDQPISISMAGASTQNGITIPIAP